MPSIMVHHESGRKEIHESVTILPGAFVVPLFKKPVKLTDSSNEKWNYFEIEA